MKMTQAIVALTLLGAIHFAHADDTKSCAAQSSMQEISNSGVKSRLTQTQTADSAPAADVPAGGSATPVQRETPPGA